MALIRRVSIAVFAILADPAQGITFSPVSPACANAVAGINPMVRCKVDRAQL